MYEPTLYKIWDVVQTQQQLCTSVFEDLWMLLGTIVYCNVCKMPKQFALQVAFIKGQSDGSNMQWN